MLTHEGVAERWVDGLRGDWSVLAELCSPAMRVWHSFDGLWLERDESEARMAASADPAALSRLEDIRTQTTERGFIVQASISIESGATPAVRTHILQVLTVVDGLVARCEEYVAPETPS